MIRTDLTDRVAILHLDHPPVNALDAAHCTELAAAFVDAQRRSDVKGVVLTGAGRCFCAGVNLDALSEATVRDFERLPGVLSELTVTLMRFEKPYVAAINGAAIAGGCVIAAAADLRLMARGRIGVSELRAGAPLPRPAYEVLRSSVGTAVARRMIYSGRAFTPLEAVEIGLVDEVVEVAELLDAAIRRVEELASAIPPRAFAYTKRQLAYASEFAIGQRGAAENREAAELWAETVSSGWAASYLAGLRHGPA